MRYRHRIALLSTILIAVICFAVVVVLPPMLQGPHVQSRIRELISDRLPAGVKIGKISLGWLPFPHFIVRDVIIRTEEFSLNVPLADVYPDWLSPVTGEPVVQRVILENPFIKLLKYGNETENRISFSQLPDMCEVRNGRMEVASGIYVPGLLFGDRSTIFTGLNVKFSVDRGDHSGHVFCSCNAPYARSIHLEASVGEDIRSFNVWMRLQHLNLNRLFKYYISDSEMPDASDINLFISAASDHPGFYSGTVKADTPCITLPDRKKNINISCGVLAMDVNATPEGVRAVVKQLDLEYPGINLSGVVNMKFPEDKDRDALWDIDLKARNVDLSGIRRVVLNLFGKSKEARRVCDIVRGGRASSLNYRFAGTTADFEFLDRMLITAEVDQAPIYLPDPDLLLDEASGPVKIEGGVLYGHDLTARMGKSRGENGTLVLGLSDHLFQFELSLDLEADLQELQPVLEHLIDDSRVVNEIRKFHKVRGKARGSLKIAPDLRDFDVYVKVHDVRGSAFYDRLGWPVSITGGSADVGPHSVSWNRVRGTAGRSRIEACSGMVDWKGETELDISEFSGRVNGLEFFTYLNSFPDLFEDISPVVTGLDGTLTVHAGKLHGPAFEPEKWHYSLNASPVSISIDSPLLPSGVKAVSGRAVLTDRQFRLDRVKVDVAGDAMALSGRLSHHFLRDWSGRLNFSGVVGQALNRWVVNNGWTAECFSLSTPCYLRPSSLDFDADSAHFKGTWVFDRGTRSKRTLHVNRRQGKEGFALEEIRITAPDESVSMKFIIPASGKWLDFSYKGTLSAATADRIFEHNTILNGRIAGDFSMCLGQGGPEERGLMGGLEISGLNWIWAAGRPVQIRTLKLDGHGASAAIRQLSLGLGEDQLEITGMLHAVSDGITYDLHMLSPLVHRSSLQEVLGQGGGEPRGSASGTNSLVSESTDKSGRTGSKIPSGGSAEDVPDNVEPVFIPDNAPDNDTVHLGNVKLPLKIYGIIEYDFDMFVDTLCLGGGHDDCSRPVPVELSELSGTMEFSPDRSVKTDISSSILCGMNFTGSQLEQPGEERLRSFVLKTPKDTENSFEDIEQCFGLDAGIFQGPVRVNAAFDITGERITKGHVDIDAHDGKIRGFTMLSRIFSVVNMVDFLGKKGWQEITDSGLAFSKTEFRSIIADDVLKIERAAVFGNGLNLFASGSADIASGMLDVVVVLAPLKTVDAIVTNIPLLGKGFGGEHSAFLTIPVGVKGSLADPDVSLLPGKTVADLLKKLLAGPLKAPFQLLGAGFSKKEQERPPRPGGKGVPNITGSSPPPPAADDTKASETETHAPSFDPDE